MSEFDEYIKSILTYSELSDIEQDELFLEMYDHLNSLKEEYMEFIKRFKVLENQKLLA